MSYEMMKKWPWCTTDAGLLVLRIGVGIIFIITGWMKVSDLHATVGLFTSMGFGPFWAYLVSFIELLGGIMVLLGFYSRIAAGLLAVTMIVATYVVFKSPTPMMALSPFSLIFSAVALKLAGPGKYSIKD